ncbi:MAG: hypothetical protein ACRDVP_01575 [Acidimicrobiales bacterium]
MAFDPLPVVATLGKHEIAGIVVIVVGALIALVGVVRGLQRLSGAALVVLVGIVILVIGALVYTRTIHP